MRESGQNVRAGNRPKWVTELIGVLADILIAAVILLVFAYIHHGRAYLFGKLEADMASAVPVSSVADAPVRDERHEGVGVSAGYLGGGGPTTRREMGRETSTSGV